VIRGEGFGFNELLRFATWDSISLVAIGEVVEAHDGVPSVNLAETLGDQGLGIQSPNEIPIALAARITSKSTGTLRVRPTIFSSGTATMSGG
jgi:hypothetical protein